MRFAAYAGTSVVLATGVIVRALHQRANFYSASVYLAQSNACLMVLTNLVLLGLCTVMLGLQKLFYGPLRPIEIEQLYEKAWFAITETCLAMTIFRDEVGAWFLVMFVCLLVGKVWGWIGEGRVEILEQQPPADPRIFHTRISFSLIISSLFDVYLLRYSIQTVLLQARPNMMVMFAFEFAVLTVTSLSTAARYILTLYEFSVIKSQINGRRAQLQQDRQHSQTNTMSPENTISHPPAIVEEAAEDITDTLDTDVPGWEEKGRWVFYLDLATDFFKLLLYLTFFCVLCVFYGMPIHIIRDVALTIRSFYKRINDFIRYRQATRDMNSRYPDATSDEISAEDVCIICREDMHPWQPSGIEQPNLNPANDDNENAHSASPANERLRPKKLPCGHVLHFACLRSWLERQQNCPTCRAPVLVQNHEPVTSTTGANPPNPPGIRPQNQFRQFQGRVPAHIEARQPAIGQNVFNLGPFRLAFGVRQGFAGPDHIANQPDQQAPIPVAAELQRIDNAFRLFRQTPASDHRTAINSAQSNMQFQLQQIEQQLLREINDIRAHTDQLFLVRALQGELSRLRQTYGTLEPSINITQVAPPGSGSSSHPNLNSQVVSYNQVFSSNHQPQRPDSGHQELPSGMTIPDGWSVLPLQRLPDRISLDPSITHPLQASDGNSFGTNGDTMQRSISQTVINSSSVPEPNDSLQDTTTPNSIVANQHDTPLSLGVQSDGHSVIMGSVDRPIESHGTINNVTPKPYPMDKAQGSNLDFEDASQISQAMSMTPNGMSTSTDQGEGSWGKRINKVTRHRSLENSLQVDADAVLLTENNREKGKGKATTVEDFVEDID